MAKGITLTPTVENVLTVWEDATDAQRDSGMNWYEFAHAFALEISGGDITRGAGVIAALSPNKAWPVNMTLARRAFEDGEASGTLGNAVGKANAILAGSDPLEVLGNGLKTRNFYLNIRRPECAEAVTIDRHAYDVALGERNAENKRLSLTPGRYEAFCEVYRLAALETGVIPQQMQAVTWEAWRDRWAWRKA